MINSIRTNISAYYAQANIGKASDTASTSVSRLSSGSKIVRASDDVAALAQGTSLQTNVTTLRTALQNASQGTSLLQVADGGLGQIQEILQRQKAIAVQANSGSVDSSARSFLQLEFENLTAEIDRITSQTNFNGVKLLNGALSEAVSLRDKQTLADKGELQLSLATNAANGQTVIVNGVTLTATVGATSGLTGLTQFEIGSDRASTVANLANKLNGALTDSSFSAADKLKLSQAIYEAQGETLVIKSRSGGQLSERFTVNLAGTAISTAGVSGEYGGTYFNVFTSGFSSLTTAIATTTAAASTPFQSGDSISVSLGGRSISLGTVTNTLTLQGLAQLINNNTSTHGVTARLVYDPTLTTGLYNLRLETNNSTTGNVVFSGGTSFAGTAATGLSASNTATSVTRYGLTGGVDNGLGSGNSRVTGSVGNDLLTTRVQTSATGTFSFANLDLSAFTDKYLSVLGVNFRFTSNTTRGLNDVLIGATQAETLDNLVATINSYNGAGFENYQFNQIRANRVGNAVTIQSKDAFNVTKIDGTAITSLAVGGFSGTQLSVSGAGLNDSSTGGVVTYGVSNKDFIGQIGGFTATATSTADQVNLTIKVGEYTYTATNVSTKPTSDTTVRFTSANLADGSNGGYFDVVFKANSLDGVAVSDATTASVFASKLNDAFSSLQFYQNRQVSSYAGGGAIQSGNTVTGSLLGTKLSFQNNTFDSIKIDAIKVSAPQGISTNGSITFSINGVDYTANNLGTKLGANQTFKLQSAEDTNSFLEFTTGNSTIDFSSANSASAFELALRNALGVTDANGNAAAALNFQVGTTASDKLSVSIANISTNVIFGGLSLKVTTQDLAAVASNQLDEAINLVTSVRANVGALQSRFNFASNNIQSSIQNQDAARGILLDTDVATESTTYATAQVQLQAGISVLAQANQQLQQLLKLITA